MSYHQQYQDRVRQALATDARAAGTTIDELPDKHIIRVVDELATLYPGITHTDIAAAINDAFKEETTS